MSNIFLCVDQSEESKVMSLGAKYQEFCNQWYINTSELKNLQSAGYKGDVFLANIYAKSFYLAKSPIMCPSCGMLTCVYAVIVNPGYRLNHELGFDGLFDKTFVINIEFYNWDLYRSIILPHTHNGYRSDECNISSFKRAIINHCHHCMYKFDDFNLFRPGHEFLPLSLIDSELIKITEFKAPIFLFGVELGIWLPQHDQMIKITNEEFKQESALFNDPMY